MGAHLDDEARRAIREKARARTLEAVRAANAADEELRIVIPPARPAPPPAHAGVWRRLLRRG